jgi:hypothetical protein
MGIFKENGLIYTGAGVLILEDYYTKDGNIEECILLVRNAVSKLYSDFGGSYESKHESLSVTAQSELREESRNLFNIARHHLKTHINIVAGKLKNKEVYYRAYLIKINGVSRKYFDHNVKVMESLYKKGGKVPHYWRETDSIAHIPIRHINFANLDKRGRITLTDIDGNDIEINRRAKHVIYNSRDLINNLIKKQPIARKKDIIIYKSESKDWTNNTYSYEVV